MTEIGEGVSVDTTKVDTCACTSTGHPIDVATGKVFTVAKDVTFAKPFSIGLFRTWISENADKQGIFGRGWTCFLDLKVKIFPNDIIFRDDEGREISFPVITIGHSFYKACERLTLFREEDSIEILADNGNSYIFSLHSKSSQYVLTEIISPDYNTIFLTYQNNRLSELTDSANNRYILTYDSKQRLVKIVRITPLPETTRLRRYEYNDKNQLTAVYDELFNSVYYEYNSDNYLIKETNRNGYSFYYEYDKDGWCVKNWGDGGEYHRELKYFPDQHKTEVINSFNQKTTYYWNNLGMVTLIVDAAGGIRQFHYDGERKLIGEVDENQETITYDYDLWPRVIKNDQENNEWTKEHTGSQRQETTDPLGNRIRRHYDTKGDLVFDEDEEGNRLIHKREDKETGCKYDLKGNLVAKIDKNNHRTTYGYDAENNLIWFMDPLGYKRHFLYKGFNKKVEERDENGNCIKFEFNEEGKLKTILNEKAERHFFKYDPLERLIEDSGFDGYLSAYKYDPAGNIIQIKGSDGSILDISYSQTERVSTIKGVDAGGTTYLLFYKYDKAGRLIEARNEHSVVKFEYDTLGRIVREYQNDHIIERVYDPEGNLVYRKSPWNTSTGFNYDENNRLIEVVLPDSKSIHFKRSQLGQPIERHLPGGGYSHCTHDAGGNLLSQDIRHKNNTITIQRKYRYNARGRLARLSDNDRHLKKFVYDGAGRLTKVIQPHKKTENFEYDSAGNLLNNGKWKNAEYKNGNRLISNSLANYKYNQSGSLIKKTNTKSLSHYGYNIFNQLIYYVSSEGTQVEFKYDALGRRIEKNSRGNTTKYYWDQLHLLGEEENSNQIEYIFYPNNFVPIARLENGNSYFYHTDPIGTPREITDKRGDIVWTGDYETLGLCDVSDESSIESHFRFQGQYFDKETGLHYNGFRYYDPETGRYITKDPISYLSEDFNLYRYCLNDPVNRTDALGLGTIAIGAGVGTAVAPGIGTLVGVAVGGLILIGICIFAQEVSKPKAIPRTKEKCKEKEKEPCPPCVPPVGTIAYRLDTDHSHGGMKPHVHLYERHQNPNNCQCFWKKLGVIPPPPPPNAIPMP